MRILIVHRYFWPDTPNCGNILWHISRHLQEEGHTVKVLTALPSKNKLSFKNNASYEVVDHVMIRRLNLPNESNSKFLRIYNAIKLGFASTLEILNNKYDIVVTTSIPPILGAFFPALATYFLRNKFIYYCMDLHPEIGKISGDFTNPILYKLLESIDNWSCKRASSIIVHSNDMKASLMKRRESIKYKIDIINNFSIPSKASIDSKFFFDIGASKNKLTVIFVGNIGRFQGLEDVINSMTSINYRDDIELVVIGDGLMKDKLINIANIKKVNVRLFQSQPLENIKDAIQQSDIGLVTLSPRLIRYAYPSKTMTYLEQGRPIIACIEKDSELVRTMQSEGYGFGISNDDIGSLPKLLINLADDLSWKNKMNQAAFDAFDKHFSKEVILQKWSEVLLKDHFVTKVMK